MKAALCKLQSIAGREFLEKGLGALTLRAWDWVLPRRRLLGLSFSVALAAGLVLFLVLRLLLPSKPPPPDLYEQGRDLYQLGNYTFAVDKLRQEIELHSGRQEARLLLAQSLITLRQWEPAQGYLRERLAAMPQDGQATYWLGKALYGAGRTAEAERSWQTLLERKEPGLKSKAGLALAEMQYTQGDYNRAAQLLYQALIAQDPLDPAEEQRADYLYGVLLARDLRFDDALTQLQKAAEIKVSGIVANNGSVQNTLANTADHARQLIANLPAAKQEKVELAKRAKLAYALVLVEEFAPAQEQLLQVLGQVPNFPDARAYLGLVYWRTGRTPQAISALLTALNQEPKNRLARETLAQIYTERIQNYAPELQSIEQVKTETENARKLLESLLSEKPDDVLILVDMARLYVATREYDRAEAFYYLAIQQNKEKPVAGVNPGAMLTRFYAETGYDPCKRGVDAGLQATRDQPQDPESWYAYGLAYAFCHKPNEAATPLEKALALRPNWPAAAHRLALVYQELGKNGEANKLFARATDLDPATNWTRF
jgi:tetratricopeptide (TPR) repeat protein